MPEFDADGNQLYIQTETGNWALNYNVANRPTDFSCMDEEGNFITVKCDYDFMGRRVFKKVISGTGTVTSHHPPPQTLSVMARRACYACLPSQSGNAAEAGCDLTRTNHPALWLITWDPTQPVATRPLAIQKDGTWYTYGLDLTKNVCEVFGPAGNIRTAYTYSPYGSVTATGNVTQPIQWSSEFYDEELGLVYYNYRYYNALYACWCSRDLIKERDLNIYIIHNPALYSDILGAWHDGSYGSSSIPAEWGHSDFEGNKPNGPFDYTLEDKDEATRPMNPKSTWRHFRSLDDSEKDLTVATKNCNKNDFERYAHQMQDFFAHYGQGYRAIVYDYSKRDALYMAMVLADENNYNVQEKINAASVLAEYPLGHGLDTVLSVFTSIVKPDNAEYYKDAYNQARERSQMWYKLWNKCCVCNKDKWIKQIGHNNIPICENLKQPSNPYGEVAAPPIIPKKQTNYNYESDNVQRQRESPSAIKGFDLIR